MLVQLDQPPLGAVCHMVYMAVSLPMPNNSSRPSVLVPMVSEVIAPPMFSQDDQPPPTLVCQMVCGLLLRVTTCKRPSAFFPTTTESWKNPPPKLFQPDQFPPGEVCQL